MTNLCRKKDERANLCRKKDEIANLCRKKDERANLCRKKGEMTHLCRKDERSALQRAYGIELHQQEEVVYEVHSGGSVRI
jgi:hypothetical protein